MTPVVDRSVPLMKAVSPSSSEEKDGMRLLNVPLSPARVGANEGACYELQRRHSENAIHLIAPRLTLPQSRNRELDAGRSVPPLSRSASANPIPGAEWDNPPGSIEGGRDMVAL